MSYDIYLRGSECPTCKRKGPEPILPNPTYNLTAIFDFALTGESLPNPDVSEGQVVIFKAPTDRPRGLRILSGRRAEETITVLEEALARIQSPALEESFRALLPANGWGTLPGAIVVLEILLEEARQHPWNVWEIG
jgi:hypothetical protein